MKSSLIIVTACCLTLTALASPQDDPVVPGRNLILNGVPAIPKSIAREASRYTEYRRAKFMGWHPELRRMLIRTRFANTSQIHRIDHPGGARRQITYFDEPVLQASYGPAQGGYFVFAKDTGGDEFYQIYRFDEATGRETLLTDGKTQHLLGPWSNRGQWLAFHRVDAEKGGAFTEIYAIDPVHPESKRLIAKLNGGGWMVTDWSPDDQQLLAQEIISINQSRLWLVDLGTGDHKPLTDMDPREKIAYANPRFAKDGKHVYVATDRNSEFLELTKFDLAKNTFTSLTPDIPWDVISLEVSRDGGRIAFVTNEEGASRLRLLDAVSEQEMDVPELPLSVMNELHWRGDSKELAFSLVSAHTAGDVYSVNVASGAVERWTFSETGGLDPNAFVEPRLIRWKGMDDRIISGFLYPPPERFRGKRPVIIYIHGGPERQARPTFNGAMNYFINVLGVTVIEPNVRGSSGFGKTFLQLDDGYNRVNAYKDIEGLLNWIAENNDLDPERIMVTGFSYGGHMTLAAATLYDSRICCSVDVVGIGNLRTFLENTQGYRRDLRRAEYGDERDPKMREFLDRIAPINHAQEITKPLLIIQGENDPRVPKSESDQMVRTLKKNGTPVWYVVAKDEGHGFRKKRNADFQFYTTIRFVQEFLLAPSSEVSSASLRCAHVSDVIELERCKMKEIDLQ